MTKLAGYRAELDRAGIDPDLDGGTGRGVPRLAAAARDALRARADPAARVGARHAPAPVRLGARGRHQRQVVGDRDDRGAARGARASPPAPTSRRTTSAGASGSGSGGAEIEPDAFGAAVERVAQAVEVVDRTLDEGEAVTQFEADTAAAFVALAAARVEAAVIEAGLGGRLDATNVIPSQVTVLTSVGLEHTEFLGATETEIAAEKLAVLRDHTTLVTGPLSPEVEAARAPGGRRAQRPPTSPCATSSPRSSWRARRPTCAATSPSRWPRPRRSLGSLDLERVRGGRGGARPARADGGDRRRPAAGPRRRAQPGRGGGARRGAAGGRRRAPGDRLPGGARRQGRGGGGRGAGAGARRGGRDRGAGRRARLQRGGPARGRWRRATWPRWRASAGFGWVEEVADPAAAVSSGARGRRRPGRRGPRHRLPLPAPLRRVTRLRVTVIRRSAAAELAHVALEPVGVVVGPALEVLEVAIVVGHRVADHLVRSGSRSAPAASGRGAAPRRPARRRSRICWSAQCAPGPVAWTISIPIATWLRPIVCRQRIRGGTSSSIGPVLLDHVLGADAGRLAEAGGVGVERVPDRRVAVAGGEVQDDHLRIARAATRARRSGGRSSGPSAPCARRRRRCGPRLIAGFGAPARAGVPGQAPAPAGRRTRDGRQRPNRGPAPQQPIVSDYLLSPLDRGARSELLHMMGLVAAVVAIVILVFFGLGYLFGRLFL